MRKWLATLLLMIGLGVPVFAQTITTGTLTSATCSGNGTQAGCLVVGVNGVGAIGIQITGTFSGTLTFKSTAKQTTDCSSGDFTLLGMVSTATPSATPVTTATAVGNFVGGVGGQGYVCVVFTSYSSGSAVVTTRTAPTSGRATGGGSGGGGGSGDALVADPLSQFASTTSAQLRSVLADESGNGAALFANGALGAATATSINKVTITAPATGSTLTLADGKTLTVSNTMTQTATDASTIAFGAGGTVAYTGVDINTAGQVTALHMASPVTVAMGGTGLSAGTSGGVLAYTASGTLASSGTLTANRLVIGGGAGAVPTVVASLGTTTTVLHGNAAGAPTYGAVSLLSDVTGINPSTTGGTGNGFTKFTGPTTTERSFALPDASATILTSNTAVTVAQGGCGTTTLTAKGILFGNGTSACGVTAVGSAGQVLTSNGPGVSPTFTTLTGTGTVTEVIVTVPSWLTATGCDITTTGTCAITASSQSQNLFLASPNGSSGASTMRAILSADLPTGVTEAAITTGQTLTLYGTSYEVTMAAPATIVLPTTTAHGNASLGFRATSTSAAWTLDGNGSQEICDSVGCATTKTYAANESKLLLSDIAGTYWQVISGEKIISGTGGGAVTETALTGNTTLAYASPAGRKTYTVDCAGCTLTLPAVSGHTGEEFEVRLLPNSGLVTIDGNGSETVAGRLTQILWASSLSGESIVVRDNGSAWIRVGGNKMAMSAALTDTAGQSILGGGWRTIAMNTLSYGTAAIWDSGNSRGKAPRPGLWMVTGSTLLENGTATYAYISVTMTNTSPLTNASFTLNLTGQTAQIFNAVADDWFNIVVYPDGTADARVGGSNLLITEILQ